MIDRKRVLFIPTVFSTLLLLIISVWSAPAFSQEPPELAGTLDAHNQVRQAVNNGTQPGPNNQPQPAACPALPNFVWNNALAAQAQAWADNCVFAHSTNRPIPSGENISAGGPTQTGPQAAGNWASESANFDYANNQTTGGQIGHYTQMAWASTMQLGCGIANCPNIFNPGAGDFIVCQYAPAGNFPTRPYCTANQTTDCEMGPGDPNACGGGGDNKLLTVTKNGTGAGTVTSAPAGINCGGDCTENYPDNTQVTLTAAAAGGSNFVGWGGDCLFAAGNPTCQITMNAAKIVSATFNTDGGGNACTGAADLTCGVPLNGTTVGATADFNNYNCAGGPQAGTDVVFKLTPPQGGNVTVNLQPNANDLDLFVLNGCATNNCPDGSENFPGPVAEQVIFAAVGGQTYDIVVEDFNSAGDTFVLTATCPGGGCNAPDGQDQNLANTTENVDRTVHVCGTITTGAAYVIGGAAHVTLIAPTAVIFGNGFSVLTNGKLTVKHN